MFIRFFFHGSWRKNLQTCLQKYSCRNVALDDFNPWIFLAVSKLLTYVASCFV